jgi:hypothetical protein
MFVTTSAFPAPRTPNAGFLFGRSSRWVLIGAVYWRAL